MRTRLATREGHVNDALEDVAKKAFFLCRKYMKSEKMVRIAGDRRWAEVNLRTLRDVEVSFEMVSYNPIRQNPSVLAETLMQMLPFLAQDPNVDSRRLVEEVISGLGMPARILLPEEDVAAMQEAQMQAAQQEALGGAAAGEPAQKAAAAEELSQLSPEEQLAAMELLGGAAPEDSFAAGGGSPVREGAEA